MIVGLGIDITEIERISRTYERFGQHFLQKILTPAELAALPRRPVNYIAGRFAAKEAAVKALGTGFADGISPLQVSTGRSPAGAPLLSFSGAALERAQSLGVRSCRLSISHERSVAVAVVILENE